MLQEASKIITSAFSNSFIKKLSLYLHDCVREEVKSSTFRNLKQDKDNKWFFTEGDETLLKEYDKPYIFDGKNSKITELMVHSEMSKKDHYLIYGYLFLKGKKPGSKRNEEFLTPLLYAPCRLERSGVNIVASLTDENLSLNTGALSGLMTYEDEDEIEHLFAGLIDVVPDLPLNNDKLQIFLTTIKSLVPNIDIEFVHLDDSGERLQTPKTDELHIADQSAVILTKRPTITAGVLHELIQISEKSTGTYRETALNLIQEEFNAYQKGKYSQFSEALSKEKKEEPYVIHPLEISDSQKKVIDALNTNSLVAVCGPPGTGKSQTIVNLVSHLVASGKSVLVASRMDKAVDVISERLNTLGAPYLCLRAGRANYQKQLNIDLQNILAGKSDLDMDAEDAIFLDKNDMKEHNQKVVKLEDNCENIINLESFWQEALIEYENFKKTYNAGIEVSEKLTKQEITNYKKMLTNIEKNLEHSNIINGFLSKITFKFLSNKLGLKDIKLTDETLYELNKDLELKELKQNLKSIEIKINKIGNLHEILDKLKELKSKQKDLAIDILKNQRRNSLKSLTQDQYKRQRLLIHAKSLVERKKNLQNRLLEEEDFSPLLEAFPCWATTTYAISETLPLKPGLFDVAIIDEASQCDIASCFPVLFRAKKAVIVGDDKQLPHMSFLEKAKEQSFLSQYEIPDKYQLIWRFRTNSMFDIANFYSTSPILLDEHFRSYPQIINFSNKEFYGDKIRIMKRTYPFEKSKCNIDVEFVENGKCDLDTTRNMAECEAVMEKIQEIINKDNENPDTPPVSIGIISPFRGQVELIKKAVNQLLSDETVKRHSLEIGTAHAFQGDEKDIILLSWAIAENSHFQSLTFLQKPNLFNVAITRARNLLINFVSKKPETLSKGLFREYLEYIRLEKEKAKQPLEEFYNSSVEKEFAQLLKDEALKVYPNFTTAGFNVDMIVTDADNISSLVILFDGFKKKNSKKKKQKEIWKQSILERSGWKVIRITARDWHYSQKACVNRVKDALIRIEE